jgi:hypothetical protein
MPDAALDAGSFHIDTGRIFEELLIAIDPVFPQEPQENGPSVGG